jgi:predicted S18 family serine protease
MSSVTRILALLLILSLAVNVYLAVSSPLLKGPVVLSFQKQADGTGGRVVEREAGITSPSRQGYAFLQGPAVMQKVQVTQNGYFPVQQVVTEGTMINISVEIRPGQGRVLVETTPLMGVVFQDAANTAVSVAQNRTGTSLAGSDVIFSVEAENEIPEIDGPSAGALMTTLVMAAVEHETPRNDITLTGTIDMNGKIGAIGGVLEKAQAARDSGKTEILLPRENARLVQYLETTRTVRGGTMIQRTPQTIDAKEYIENNVGIHVTYVDSIGDVLGELGMAG